MHDAVDLFVFVFVCVCVCVCVMYTVSQLTTAGWRPVPLRQPHTDPVVVFFYGS